MFMTPIVSPTIRLRLIGSMGVWTSTGQDLLPEAPKSKMMLAAVALSAPRPIMRTKLSAMIWPGLPVTRAHVMMRHEIRRLANALAVSGVEPLRVSLDRLSFEPNMVRIDVADVMRATPDDPTGLSLLDRELLEDLSGLEPAFDPFLRAARDRVRAHARMVAESLLPRQMQPDETILAARRLLFIDPSHEGAWRGLMNAHASRGEPRLAMAVYEACRAAMHRTLGVTPSSETQALLRRIRHGAAGAAAPRRTRATKVETASPVPAVAPVGGDVVTVTVQPFRATGMPVATGKTCGQALADQLASALSRFRWLTVAIPPHASGTRDAAADPAGLTLDGTIHRHGGGVRVSLRLLEAGPVGQVIWARRFDRTADELERWRDDVTAAAAAQIGTECLMADANRRARAAVQDETAQGLMLRAVQLMGALVEDKFRRAGEYLSLAIAREPDHAPSHAFHAMWHTLAAAQGWSKDPAGMKVKARLLTERALALDPKDPLVLTMAAHARASEPGDTKDAEALHQKALDLNPHFPIGWALAALTAAYAGDANEAERRFRRYKQLSPFNPFAGVLDVIAPLIHLLKRDHVAAAAAGRTITQVSPAMSAGYKHCLSALGHLGLRGEADVVFRRLAAIEPGFSVERFLAVTPLREPADRDHYADGLRRAGVPLATSSIPSGQTPVLYA